MVLCRHKGLVTAEYCGQCTDHEFAKEGNPFGNSTQTCQYFGKIVRDHTEQIPGVQIKQGFGREQQKGDTAIVRTPVAAFGRSIIDDSLKFGWKPKKIAKNENTIDLLNKRGYDIE